MKSLCVDDEVVFPKSFTDGFIRSVGKKMEGRTAKVRRIYSVNGYFGLIEMIEFVFIAPTTRHKPFIFSMYMHVAVKALEQQN